MSSIQFKLEPIFFIGFVSSLIHQRTQRETKKPIDEEFGDMNGDCESMREMRESKVRLTRISATTCRRVKNLYSLVISTRFILPMLAEMYDFPTRFDLEY